MPTALPAPVARIVPHPRPRLWRTIAWAILALLTHALGRATMACARLADRIIGS